MNVVIFARVSTNKQDYERQVDELLALSSTNGWSVCKIITGKVSGSRNNKERKDIKELFRFVEKNADTIDKVLVTEISRLGRDTLQALEVLNFLKKNSVSLYIKNIGMETLLPDKKENPLSQFLCTILVEVSRMEKTLIIERLNSGLRRYLAAGGPMGRKPGNKEPPERTLEKYNDIVRYIKKDYSVRDIARITGHSTSTVQKVRNILSNKTKQKKEE